MSRDVVARMRECAGWHEGEVVGQALSAGADEVERLGAALAMIEQDDRQDARDLARLHALVTCEPEASDLHDHTACVVAEVERLRRELASTEARLTAALHACGDVAAMRAAVEAARARVDRYQAMHDRMVQPALETLAERDALRAQATRQRIALDRLAATVRAYLDVPIGHRARDEREAMRAALPAKGEAGEAAEIRGRGTAPTTGDLAAREKAQPDASGAGGCSACGAPADPISRLCPECDVDPCDAGAWMRAQAAAGEGSDGR